MTKPDNSKKEEYAKSVCLFLSELLRTRKISLTRAAEIAQKVIYHLNLIDTEQDFLRFIKELSSDFEELYKLEQRVMMHAQINKRQEMEANVREFVVTHLLDDTKQALDVLTEAIKQENNINQLSDKFPAFKEFMLRKNGII